MEKLKAELLQQLQRETEDKEILKQQVNELSRDIELLKQSLESLPKRQWSEMFMTRASKWASQFNLRQLSASTKVVKLFLPDSSKDALDSFADAIDGIAEAAEHTPDSPTEAE